jgi:hypothetical protein
MASGNGAAKTVCPVDLATFLATAGALVVTIRRDGESKPLAELTLDARDFQTGSFGWYANEKVRIPVVRGKDAEGKPVVAQCLTQCNLGFTVANSKEAPRTAAPAPAVAGAA